MINLSELFKLKHYHLDDVVSFCLDNQITTIVNDFSPRPPFVEYELCDLEHIWPNLQKLYKLKNEK